MVEVEQLRGFQNRAKVSDIHTCSEQPPRISVRLLTFVSSPAVAMLHEELCPPLTPPRVHHLGNRESSLGATAARLGLAWA